MTDFETDSATASTTDLTTGSMDESARVGMQMPRWYAPHLLSLLCSGSLTVMTGAVLAPILPELVADLSFNPGWAGTLMSAHYLTLALFSPILGSLADRIGQLRLLIPMLGLYGLIGVAGGVMPNFHWLLLDRGLLGVACSGIAAASLGLLSQLYRGEARTQAIAYVATALTLANIVYPLLAGAIGLVHWKLAFGIYGLGIPLALWVLRIFRSPQRSGSGVMPAATGEKPPAITEIVRDRQRLRILLALVLASGIVYGTVIYLPIYLKTTLAASTGLNGGMLALQAVGAAISAAWGLKGLTRRWGSLRVICGALGLMAAILISIPALHSLGWIALASLIYGASFGLVTPSLYTLLANLTPANAQSSALSMGIGAGFLGQFVAPFVLAPVLNRAGIAGVFDTIALGSIGMGLLMLWPMPETIAEGAMAPDELPAAPPVPPETADLR